MLTGLRKGALFDAGEVQLGANMLLTQDTGGRPILDSIPGAGVFQPPFPSAIIRPVPEKFGESPSVADWQVYGLDPATDTVKLQTAINETVGRRLRFNDDVTYRINQPLYGLSGTFLDLGRARIEGVGRIPNGLMQFNGATDITIRGGIFDQGHTVLPTYVFADYPNRYNIALYFENGCRNIKVIDSDFLNLYTNAVFVYQSTGTVDLERLRFYAPARTQRLLSEHIILQSNSAKITVDNIEFENAQPASSEEGVCQVFMAGNTRSVLINNIRSNFGGRGLAGQHQLGAIACYQDNQNVTIRDSRILNTLAIGVRLTAVTNGEVTGCTITGAPNAEPLTELISIQSSYNPGVNVAGTNNVRVHNNYLIDLYDPTRIGVLMSAYDYGYPSKDVSITQNTFYGTRQAVRMYGTQIGTRIERNAFRAAAGMAQISLTAESGAGGRQTTLVGVSEAQSAFENLSICDNEWDCAPSGTNPIYLDYLLPTTPYTGKVGGIKIDRNTFTPRSAMAVPAIIIRGVQGVVRSRLMVRGNEAVNFTTVMDAADVQQIIATDNIFSGIAAPFNVAGARNGGMVITRNKYGFGDMSGVAMLVNGLVRVYTDELRVHPVDSRYRIRLTRTETNGGGTTTSFGILVIGNLLPGSWFEILSMLPDASAQNSNDFSGVLWEIEH